MKLIVRIGLLVISVLPVRAQEPDGLPEPSPTPERVLMNQKLAAKVEEVMKTALVIRGEDDGRVFLPIAQQSFAPKTQFVFFRRRGTRLSMIAQGVVEGEREASQGAGRELIVNIDKDAIVKYPEIGDLGVPLADPLSLGLGERRENSNAPVVPETAPREDSLPGYFQFGMGLIFSQLYSDGDPQVGGGKNSMPFRFLHTQFEYFSGLLPIGLGLTSHSGRLPTQTYEGDVVNSSESVQFINLYYRFKPTFNQKLFVSARGFLLSDQLTTDNRGSELLSTEISAFGVGLRAQYHWVSDVWRPKNQKGISVALQSLWVEGGFSPFVSAKDGSPSRGTSSSGSTLLDYRLGATGFIWLGFVPLFKRWFVQGSYGARLYSLKFQGPTISESGNPIPVAQGLSMNESEKDFRFTIGIRIDDPVASIFSAGPEKKESKK